MHYCSFWPFIDYSMDTWAVTFAQNHSNHISVWNVIYICYIHRIRNLHANIVMQLAQQMTFLMLIGRAMALANHFHVIFVEKILPENIIWIDICCIQVVINHENGPKCRVMFVTNYLAEQIIYGNIWERILVNRQGNEIINVRIAINHFMDHLF